MNNPEIISESSKKKRQAILFVAILSATIGASALLIWMAEGSEESNIQTNYVSENKTTSTNTNIKTPVEVPAQQIDPAELRIARTEQTLAQIGESSKEASKSISDTSARLKMLEDLLKEKQGDVAPPVNALPPPPSLSSPPQAQIARPREISANPPTPLSSLSDGSTSPSLSVRRLIVMDKIDSEIAKQSSSQKEEKFAVAGRSGANSEEETKKPLEKTGGDLRVDSYVPAASFVKAVLLNGLDAPTGGQAQANPQPVVMRLTDLAFLPNRYRGNIKECFILASGYGDIASERAFLRTDTLSCVNQNGRPIEVRISGYISGEDGKTGMRGRMVTKQGQVLANALLTGSISSLGKILTITSTTTTENPANILGAGGTSTTVTPGKLGQNVLGQSLNSAMEKISNYYLKLADQLFPVVEIDAGRQVEIIFTKGFSFAATDSKDALP